MKDYKIQIKTVIMKMEIYNTSEKLYNINRKNRIQMENYM